MVSIQRNARNGPAYFLTKPTQATQEKYANKYVTGASNGRMQ